MTVSCSTKPAPITPKCPERLTAVREGIEEGGLLRQARPRHGRARGHEVDPAVHTADYVKRLRPPAGPTSRCSNRPTTRCAPDTYEVALLAVGGILEAAAGGHGGRVGQRLLRRPAAPATTRKPTKRWASAISTTSPSLRATLQQEWGLHRVGIVDFDVHHGNGTQHIFEEDAGVYYYSIHQHPTFAYPGTGREFEYGRGAGYGFTKNSPVLPGQGDEDWKRLIERDLFPAFEGFKPEFILVSAGFDAHRDDDMSDIQLSTECYSWIMQQLVGMANTYTGGRIVSVLEGGYCLRRLPELARHHVEILLNG